MKNINQECLIKPIGFVNHQVQEIPRHYSISDIVGEIRILPEYQAGMTGYLEGDPDRIMVLFLFDRSPDFSDEKLLQRPPSRPSKRGVFWTCSSVRPNPVGVSILSVLKIFPDKIKVRGLDILNNTPVIDIKPWKDKFNPEF